MSHVYSSDNYHLTFFVEESLSQKLQDFIQGCTEEGFTYSVTPYGITSVAAERSKKDVVHKLFETFFPGRKKQESMVLNANTEFPAFVPFNPTFRLDVSPYIVSKGQMIITGVVLTEILHFLDLHEDMAWDFVEKTLSLPSTLGKQVFLPGQILTRFDIVNYFRNLTKITPYLGKNGHFQYLYRTSTGKTGFCRKYYEEGVQKRDFIQPTHRRQIPSPTEYVMVKPMWYDCEYK